MNNDPCVCGHSPEEHGNDEAFPGSSACDECSTCCAYESESGDALEDVREDDTLPTWAVTGEPNREPVVQPTIATSAPLIASAYAAYRAANPNGGYWND